MLVNSPCCPTCRKRIAPLQKPFKRMVMGQMTYEDACRVILHYNPSIFGFNSLLMADERLKVLDSILESELNEDQESEIALYQTKTLDVPTAHTVLGIVRLCCKKHLNDPPIAPVFASTQPEGSKRIMDKGLVKRLITREGSGYLNQNYSTNI